MNSTVSLPHLRAILRERGISRSINTLRRHARSGSLPSTATMYGYRVHVADIDGVARRFGSEDVIRSSIALPREIADFLSASGISLTPATVKKHGKSGRWGVLTVSTAYGFGVCREDLDRVLECYIRPGSPSPEAFPAPTLEPAPYPAHPR